MWELRKKRKKRRQSQSGLRQGRGGVVAVGTGTSRGDGAEGCGEQGGGGNGCRLASCQLAPVAGPCQSKLPNEKL